MYSLLSCRRWTTLLFGTVTIVVFTRLFAVSRFDCDANIQALIFSHLSRGILTDGNYTQLQHQDLSDIFDIHTRALPNEHIKPLVHCAYKPNPITNAIRIPDPIQNISLTPPDMPHDPSKAYFNPTLLPLPLQSPYPYLLLSRLVTAGLHQESHICLATLCLPDSHNPKNSSTNTTRRALTPDAHTCTPEDHKLLGPHGGIRCATPPERLNIPPTPALHCNGAWTAFPDIPGFHDPRIFWSGAGEPLVIVNSASRYACVGLWVVDLRSVYKGVGGEAKLRYPVLTELGRSKRDRAMVEKNWILFFPTAEEAWVMYDLVGHRGGKGDVVRNTSLWIDEMQLDASRSASVIGENSVVLNETGTREGLKYNNRTHRIHQNQFNPRNHPPPAHPHPQLKPARTIAKLLGSGYTTPNLTSPNESPCLTSAHLLDNHGATGKWHQGSNSLRLILCARNDLVCLASHTESELVAQGKVVHFAVLHRKFSNELDLPMRYERYIMVWEARFPFRMLGISRWPVLFMGERAQPWSREENGLGGDEEAWARVYFTYTPSLAWAWRRESVMELGLGGGTGYLGDELIVGIGMDDVTQGFVRVKVDKLVSCLRLCPDFER